MSRMETMQETSLAPTYPAGGGFSLRSKLKNPDTQRILINIGVMVGLGTFVQVHTGYFFLHRNLTGSS